MVDTPEPVAETPTAPAAPAHVKKKRSKLLLIPLVILLIPAVIIALWIWIALGWTYAKGERAGYVQKISKKGWLCKTWEGELAMANLPGTMPQIFNFSVRDDKVAEQISASVGQRVSLHYKQHR